MLLTFFLACTALASACGGGGTAASSTATSTGGPTGTADGAAMVTSVGSSSNIGAVPPESTGSGAGAISAAAIAQEGASPGAGLRFEFTLDRARTTSAGVWSSDGVLLRTLWRGEPLIAGRHVRAWDGLDDRGRPVPAGPAEIKLVHHEVRYEWDGVVGNTSSTAAKVAAGSIFRAFMRPTALASAGGGRVHVAVGYNEAQNAIQGFELDDPQTNRPAVQLVDPFITAGLVATDGARLYWTNIGGLAKRSFVAAFDLSSGRPWRFSAGTGVCLNLQSDGRTCWAPQWHPSVIEDRPDLTSMPTGLAVQAAGPLLAIAYGREGRVRLYDKVTGQWLGDIAAGASAEGSHQIAFGPDGALWILEDERLLRVEQPGPGAAAAVVVAGLVRPLALATDPAAADQVWVAEGGARQQVRRYDLRGRVLATIGQAGGLAADPAVGADRLSFADVGGRERSALLVDERGALWIADTGNNRLLQRLPDGRPGVTVAWLPAFYTSAVDPNRPERVFANFLEFEVTDQPGRPAAASWRLVRNWMPSLPAGLRDDQTANWHWGGFHTVRTLASGRTFAQMKVRGREVLVELPPQGPVRPVSTWPSADPNHSPPVMNAEGHIVVARTDAGRQSVLRFPLTGYDANGNPMWGVFPSVLASVPTGPDTPALRPGTFTGVAGPSFPQTPDGRVLFFNPGVQAESRFHLGAARMGGADWLMQAAPSGPLDGRGALQTRAHDASIQYGGNAIRTAGRHVVLGYHGEFYQDLGNQRVGQANQFMHYRDDGLFIGQFGVPSTRMTSATAAGASGNAFSPSLVTGASGDLLLYHNDESTHGGIHRWRLTGAAAVGELSVRVNAPTAVGDPARLN